ncbi:MAG: flippase [bacterium]
MAENPPHTDSTPEKKKISDFLRHGLVHNIFALYGVHFVNYLFPLVTIPYLARVLGPSTWGLVAFAQSFGQYLNLIMEYGFNLSATREVARFREDKKKLAELLAGVLGAKSLLTLACFAAALIAKVFVGNFQAHPILFWSALFWSIAQSFSPIWYYQGLERMKFVASLDVVAKTFSTLAIFLIVRSPDHAWKVLVLQGGGAFLSSSVALWIAYRGVPFQVPNFFLTLQALKMGWTMFLFRSAVSLYTVGNTFILGLFAPPEFVGFYAGAEKISKALVGLLTPINQALYPRLSYLAQESRAKAAQLTQISFKVMGGIGMLMGVVAFIGAPIWVRLFLGSGFEASILPLKILSFLPLLIALSNVLGIQWMLPLGMDRAFNWVIIGAGLLNLTLAVLLAPRFAQVGMAWAVVISEIFVTGAIFVLLRMKRLDPFSYREAQNIL